MQVLDLNDHTNVDALHNTLINRNDVWVRFNNPKQVRRGTIGRIRWQDCTEQNWLGSRLNMRWYVYVDFPGTKKSKVMLGASRWELSQQIEWLEGYTGPAVIESNPVVKQPPAVVHDMHEIEIKVGSFVVFNSGNRLVFGSVAEISPGGVVFLKRIDGSRTKVIKLNNIAVINEDFREMMMLRKLAA